MLPCHQAVSITANRGHSPPLPRIASASSLPSLPSECITFMWQAMPPFFLLFLCCCTAHFQWRHCAFHVEWFTEVMCPGLGHCRQCILRREICACELDSDWKRGSLERKCAGFRLKFRLFSCRALLWYFTDRIVSVWSTYLPCLFAMPKPGEGPFKCAPWPLCQLQIMHIAIVIISSQTKTKMCTDLSLVSVSRQYVIEWRNRQHATCYNCIRSSAGACSTIKISMMNAHRQR